MASITTQKEQLIKMFKEIIINYINNNKDIIVNDSLISSLISNLSMNSNDYKKIKEDILIDLNTNKYSIYATESENIISVFSQKLNNYKLETLNSDNEPIIYFHIGQNRSYLINYDTVELKWYLSLINSNTLELIKEIYSSNYPNFINYITKDFSSKKATE